MEMIHTSVRGMAVPGVKSDGGVRLRYVASQNIFHGNIDTAPRGLLRFSYGEMGCSVGNNSSKNAG